MDIAPIRLGILTSVDLRHRYFVNRLAAEFDVAAVGYEETGYSPAACNDNDLTPEEAIMVTEHFAERDRQEEALFADRGEFLPEGGTCSVHRIAAGQLNTPKTLEFLESAGVNTVAVYGTNLVKPPLLDHWPGRMINMHLGLSPYYRGTATNFYPLLNEEPEYVGATIHLLDAGIDSGAILKHARPTIVADDMPHTIGCKAIIAGVDAFVAVLRDLERSRLNPIPQWPVENARLYLRKDYHPRQVVELYGKLETGFVARYVERAAEAAPRVRLVE